MVLLVAPDALDLLFSGESHTPSSSSTHEDFSRALPSAMNRLSPAQRAAIMARRDLPEPETNVDLIEELEIARLGNHTHVVSRRGKGSR
jgi:hypothetical protein